MKKFVVTAIAACSIASGANATVLNLDSLATGYLTQAVQIGDYILTPALGGSATPSIQNVNGHNVIVGTSGYSGDDTYLTRADGGVFTLNSVVIGLVSGAGQTGQNVNSASYTYDLGNVATQTAQTINFGTHFQNVTKIDLDALNGAYFTTITVTSAASVPEPASWGLMILGLGMVGGAMRAQRRKAAVRFG